MHGFYRWRLDRAEGLRSRQLLWILLWIGSTLIGAAVVVAAAVSATN